MTPVTSPDPELKELEIKARERFNNAVLGALIMLALFAVIACGFASLTFLPLLPLIP